MRKKSIFKLWLRNLASTLATLLFLFAASPCFAQSDANGVAPVRTDGPRETFESFLTLTRELQSALLSYRQNRTYALRSRVARIGDEMVSLIDLSSIPEASRRQVGVETAAALLDIFGRVKLPAVDDVPTAAKFEADTTKPAKWRVPDTPIEIVRIKQGPREGEFLFSGRTVEQAPRFYREIQNLPLRSDLGIQSWSGAIPQLTGPMIPGALVSAVPAALKRPWLGTPIWKIIGIVLLIFLAGFVAFLWDRLVRPREPADTLLGMVRALLTPVAIIALLGLVAGFSHSQLNISGSFALIVTAVITLLKYLAAAWLFWLVVQFIAELIIRSPKIPEQSLDASLLRLCARLIGIVGIVMLLAYAASVLGVPVFSLIAGLGIGGLAVALAVRPTLENLIGGIILYADRPVRVGDFCSFNEHVGTIESIGVRSTQVRGRDRTLISVPNAKFADMEIVNWAHCDKMLIQSDIGLRYETTEDQLRYVLAQLREMFCAHPKIDHESVRISFVGFGASSLDVNIRVYALTREWNEFYEIREDVFLRVIEIVAEAGTGFAFPSQTLYLQRDDGLDKKRGERAADEVRSWRKSGTLPFPRMPQERADELAGTLDYPPEGSPGYLHPASQETGSEEPLSEGPDPLADDDITDPRAGKPPSKE